MGCGCELCDDFVTICKALQLVSVRVAPAAAEAMREIGGVQILDRHFHAQNHTLESFVE
jgi:hypothetical protein